MASWILDEEWRGERRGGVGQRLYTFACDGCGEKTLQIRGYEKTHPNGCKTCSNKSRMIGYQHAINQAWISHCHNAKSRGLANEISKELWWDLAQRPCHYCGVLGSNVCRVRNPKSSFPFVIKVNGVDRLDSTKGYVVGNVVPCCKFHNLAKNNLSEREFRKSMSRPMLGQPALGVKL